VIGHGWFATAHPQLDDYDRWIAAGVEDGDQRCGFGGLLDRGRAVFVT
jgi:hypothetical protein